MHAFHPSPAIRLGGLVLLGLGLLAPLSMVRRLVSERQSRAREAGEEVASRWGSIQTILPPILSYPLVKDPLPGHATRKETWIHLLPESTATEVRAPVQLRHRGLFTLPLFTAEVSMSGRWTPPAPPPGWQADWSRALVSIHPGSARTLVRDPRLEVGGRILPMGLVRPVGGPELCSLHAKAPLGSGSPVPFRLGFSQRGSEKLTIVPASGSDRTRIRSNWPAPSFQGSLLPEASRVGSTGFDARWSATELNTGLPRSWTDAEDSPLEGDPATSITVGLSRPVDGYDSVDRSMKYGCLVIALVFGGLFLFETLTRLQLHPIQYALVGAALALFYLLLLALSEHLGFEIAYSLASAAVTCAVAGYGAACLGGWSRGLLLGGGLAALWGFLLILLKAEDWSLLMGASGLFAALAATMWLTRNIEWRRRDIAFEEDSHHV